MLGEPEITPFAAERQGGGAGAKAGPAGHGVERATFTGPGGFTLAELGGLALVVVAGIPDTHLGGGVARGSPRSKQESSVSASSSGLS